jgi:hypothetical protein
VIFPDLRPHFKHAVWRPMVHSRGVPVGSDWADKADDDPVFGPWKQCGFWTVGEVEILFRVAACMVGPWLDIGGHTGWTAAHISAADRDCDVISVDPMYSNPEFRERAIENLDNVVGEKYKSYGKVFLWSGTSSEFFEAERGNFDGIVIDGDHVGPAPWDDARHADRRVSPRGVILFHDALNAAVQDGYNYLSRLGWNTKYYDTPHGVVLCYHDGFNPPEGA